MALGDDALDHFDYPQGCHAVAHRQARSQQWWQENPWLQKASASNGGMSHGMELACSHQPKRETTESLSETRT